MAKYTLPDLPYDFAALEPHISGKIMELHHDKHHQAYVTGANTALDQLAEARDSGNLANVNKLEKDLAFNLGGHVNHSIFWTNLSPEGGGEPEGELKAAIDEFFGDFEKFKAHFTAAAMGIQGSGWAVLSWDPLGEQLIIQQLFDQQSNTAQGTVPVFQLTIDVDMTRAVALREQLVARMGDGAKPTLSDVLTKISASALMRNRAVNAHYGEDWIKRFPNANVGIAVAAPQGLVVPVIQRAESLTIPEIADARAELVGRARDNKLRQGDLDGGTFTISNLGMFGVQQFIAVLNPPQAAILAVGSVEDRPVARDGEVVVRPMMTVTLTCDHRTVDGADGARFLEDVKAFLEEPGLAL